MLLWIWLVYNLCWKLEWWLYIFTTTRANRVCKSFPLSLSVYQLNCLRTRKGLSLGELIRLRRIYFSKHFCPCLDSNLHDLNGTNPDWCCFQQNCHDVIFVQKQKFSEWPETSRRLFLEIIKNIGERISNRGPHPIHEGAGRAPLGHAPCLVGPLGLHRPQPQLYIFTFGEKKIGENDSSRFTMWSHRKALFFLGRADL